MVKGTDGMTEPSPNADLVSVIQQALEDDGWLGHTEELEHWHLHAIAETVVKTLSHIGRNETDS